MVKVSYVCPIYNKSTYLKKVLNSIKNQSGSFEKEYIFIDDGSYDSSYQNLEKITKNWKNIKIFRQKNKGPAIATQRGIDNSSGDFIKLVGGDDIMKPNCTSLLLKTIEKKKSVAAFSKYSLVENFKKLNSKKNNELINFRYIENPIEQTVVSNFSGTTPTLYDHSALKKSGGCNKSIFIEDFSLVLGLSKIGNFAFIDNVTSFGPKDDKDRIMNSKKTQLIHDYNAALYYFLKKNSDLSLKIKKKACKKSLGRADKWARRNSKTGSLNKMFYLKILLSFKQIDYLHFIRESCLFFYDKIQKDEIRYKIK